ncbi:MAG: hypothetical protein JOZ40_12095 [Methylobacteriaceae bacterium]|nr:hypothetical protein [Methylobacteriaceae bacterium]
MFRTRIKKLLDLDRSWKRPCQAAAAASAAFSDAPPEGSGVDGAYTAFDAFCLAVALDFLGAGFKQQEVTLLMSRLRFTLREPFELALKFPPARTTPAGRRHHLNSNIKQRFNNAADRRIFLAIQRVEFNEEFPALAAPGRAGIAPIFQDPPILYGRDKLCEELDRMSHLYRRAMIVEIAHTAAGVVEFLKQAPAISRGRSKNR